MADADVTVAPSSMLLGPLGLNTVPSARMDKTGTVRIGVSTLDPYVHAFVGFQIADPLYIQLRQTAEVSSLNEADRLYPGVDLKLRLLTENDRRPEVSLGLQSVIGHKRMAGEYLVASKRWHDFDFTGGVGWGRYAGGWHMPNLLKELSGHFGKKRADDGEMPAAPNDWFTGDDMGVFSGVEYFTPIQGLSVKLDLGADDYGAEKTAFNFEPPPLWSVGVAYKPYNWLDMGVAAEGTDKIMARLTLTPSIENWKNNRADNAVALNPYRTGTASAAAMERDAHAQGIVLYDTGTGNGAAQTMLKLDNERPAPRQIGEAAVIMANNAGRETEGIEITPTVMGLRGPKVTMLRADFEKALGKHQGSPEEIWRHATFGTSGGNSFPRRTEETWLGIRDWRFQLDQQVSLAEEDSGMLGRTSLVAGSRRATLFGFLDTGFSFRLNLFNNLQNLEALRGVNYFPVRSDVGEFANQRVSMDEFYGAFTHSFGPNLHTVLAAGYLEEMYAGYGGEVLYRPFGPRYAFGADLWDAYKRSPYVLLNNGLTGYHVITGHLNAWYDIPDMDVTLGAKIGRYLGGDVGGTLSLEKKFSNGAALEAYATLTDGADFDEFGGITHASNGIRLTLPLGGRKHMPPGAQIKFHVEPFGRDAGQILQTPVSLYELTDPFSYEHMIRDWHSVLPDPAPPK